MQMPEKQKSECPLPRARNQERVVYQATVENANGEKETYVGLAENFKKRHYKHKSSMERKTLITPQPCQPIFGLSWNQEGPQGHLEGP